MRGNIRRKRRGTVDALHRAVAFDAPPKADRAGLELPLFALRAGDRRERVYEDAGCRVQIIPSVLGAATQHDKDVLLFCISQLVAARNRGLTIIPRTIVAPMVDILRYCRRGTGGADYGRLVLALTRLRGTTIRTNRITGGREITDGFGLIDSYRIVRNPQDERQEEVEVTVSEWLCNAIDDMDVLTLDPDYFNLRSGLERRLYELARKFCGRQRCWSVKVATLQHKSGSRSSEKDFRRRLRQIIEADSLPSYRLELDGRGSKVTVHPRAIGRLSAVLPAKRPGGRQGAIAAWSRIVDNL